MSQQPSNPTPATDYLRAAGAILSRIESTQLDAIGDAADLFANTIAEGGLVHVFGTGHSRIPVEEIFPRHGSFPGFHPIVELSLTYHNAVVGANGQRQAMYLEHVEGLARTILRNFVLRPPDSFLVFSNSGVNEVVVEVAMVAAELGLPTVGVVSLEHTRASAPKHSSGRRLSDVVDIVIDNCAPGGDAMVRISGLDDPVGPGSTIGGVAVANAIKCLVAERLTVRGQPPLVLTSSFFLGESAAQERFDACYDDYRARVRRVMG